MCFLLLILDRITVSSNVTFIQDVFSKITCKKLYDRNFTWAYMLKCKEGSQDNIQISLSMTFPKDGVHLFIPEIVVHTEIQIKHCIFFQDVLYKLWWHVFRDMWFLSPSFLHAHKTHSCFNSYGKSITVCGDTNIYKMYVFKTWGTLQRNLVYFMVT